jgi:hypothetical protein
MPLICYVHSPGDSVPYFEVLPEQSKSASLHRAGQLMAERPHAVRAELWEGDELIHILERQGAA